MTHRDITRLRARAKFARDMGERAVIHPDELDALLDLAVEQIEAEEDV